MIFIFKYIKIILFNLFIKKRDLFVLNVIFTALLSYMPTIVVCIGGSFFGGTKCKAAKRILLAPLILKRKLSFFSGGGGENVPLLNKEKNSLEK